MEVATTVLKAHCCLAIDTASATISGSVELTVSVSEGQSNVNLHAQNLKIQSVQIQDANSAWGVNEPSLIPIPEEWKQNRVKDAATDLTKQSFLQYKHIRECVLQPNLCIKLPMVISSTSSKELMMKIHYSVENPTGFRFLDDCAFVRSDGFDGVSSWMPCNETNAKHTSFDFEIAVSPLEVVICSGKLVKTWLTVSKSQKVFHYKVTSAMCLTCLCLCVGRFEVCSLPMRGHTSDAKTHASPFISCFGPSGSTASMVYTMKFFPTVFRFVEEILQTSFPFKNLKILFLPDIIPVVAGWDGCMTLSTSLLLPDKRTIDHGLHHRFQICLGLARVWFGSVVVPKTAADQWLMEGLAGWLERKLVARIVGMNELSYRREQERRLICDGDNGTLPPLYPKNGVPSLLGTEWSHCRDLFRWKSTAVMCMIEERVSYEAFKRVIERLVICAAEVCRAEATSNKRLIATRAFLKEVGQAGGIKKEIQAFAERWVYGRGCPTIDTNVGFDPKTFSLLLSMKQEGSNPCLQATTRAVKMSKDGSIGLVKVSVAEPASIASYTVQLGAENARDARFKLQGRPRKRRRTEATISITESQSPVKWVRVNPDHGLLGTIHTKQTEEMWSAMLEESKDVVAESEAINGLLSLESGALSICKTLEVFVQTSTYCRVRMEAVLALAQISSQENAYEGLTFLTDFYRSRRFDPVTTLPKTNDFTDLSELLIDQTFPIALGGMKDADGYTPKEAIELILQVLEYNNNEGNEFDDTEWIVAWLCGLEKVVAKEEEEWKAIFKVIERYLARDLLFPSRDQAVTQACLSTMGHATLHQSVEFKVATLPVFVKYVDPMKHKAGTRSNASIAVTQVSASIHGPDEAVFNAVSWLLEETSDVVCDTVFRKLLSLIHLLGAKARREDGIGWRTVSLLYQSMLDPSLSGCFRHNCLLLLFAISNESLTLYREPGDWILQATSENPAEGGYDPAVPPTPSASESQAAKKLKFKLKT